MNASYHESRDELHRVVEDALYKVQEIKPTVDQVVLLGDLMLIQADN